MEIKFLTLRDAALIAGKSERTIKRWIESGFFKDHRNTGNSKAPILIDEGELRLYLSTLSPSPEKGHVLTTFTDVSSQGKDQIIEILHAQIDDLKKDKQTLQFEKNQLKVELVDARKIIDNLQKEVIGRKGIKGLLKAFWP